jgi:hypothetical protein
MTDIVERLRDLYYATDPTVLEAADEIEKLRGRGVFGDDGVPRLLLPQLRAEIIEECAKVAEWAHMVPPDGGSPTEEERAVAEAAARNIRALAAQKEKTDEPG